MSRSATAEAALLGGLMLDASVLDDIGVTEGDFATQGHRKIYACITALVADSVRPDVIAVIERLRRTGEGDCAPLAAKLVSEATGSSNALVYAGIIREEAKRRSVQALATQVLASDEPVEGMIESAIRSLAAIGDGGEHADRWSDEVTGQAFQRLTEPDDLSARIGYADLDQTLGGFFPGDLIVIGARPAMGKTAFALNLLARGGYVGGLISGEQDEQQVGMRNLALLGPVSLHKMRTRTLRDADWQQAHEGVRRAQDRRYLIHDAPAPTIEAVRSKARRWKHQHGLQVLFVDYLQKLRGGGSDDFRIRVGMIAAELKSIARELGITVVALAQVKREVDNREVGADGTGCCPHASDLAESGMIENEADQILTLCRPAVYEPSDARWDGLVYLTIAKNRHGPERRVRLFWSGDSLRFENATQGGWERTA